LQVRLAGFAERDEASAWVKPARGDGKDSELAFARDFDAGRPLPVDARGGRRKTCKESFAEIPDPIDSVELNGILDRP
jgi:hypothetical protein